MKLQAAYPVKLRCEVLALPRSRWYFKPTKPDEAALHRAVEQVVEQFPTYGSRRVTQQLRRDPAEFKPPGRKRVRRVLGEMGLKLQRKTGKQQTTDWRHSFARYPNLVKAREIVRPDQGWVADITYVRLGDTTFAYPAILLDLFTRRMRGWSLARGLGVELTLAALQSALGKAQPEIHHSDQGVQYAATEYGKVLQERNVRISRAAVGKAAENGYAERLIRTIKEHDQGRRSRPERVPGSDSCETSSPTIHGRGLPDKANSFVAGLSGASRVRDPMVEAVIIVYTFKQQFRVQFDGTITLQFCSFQPLRSSKTSNARVQRGHERPSKKPLEPRFVASAATHC